MQNESLSMPRNNLGTQNESVGSNVKEEKKLILNDDFRGVNPED